MLTSLWTFSFYLFNKVLLRLYHVPIPDVALGSFSGDQFTIWLHMVWRQTLSLGSHCDPASRIWTTTFSRTESGLDQTIGAAAALKRDKYHCVAPTWNENREERERLTHGFCSGPLYSGRPLLLVTCRRHTREQVLTHTTFKQAVRTSCSQWCHKEADPTLRVRVRDNHPSHYCQILNTVSWHITPWNHICT